MVQNTLFETRTAETDFWSTHILVDESSIILNPELL